MRLVRNNKVLREGNDSGRVKSETDMDQFFDARVRGVLPALVGLP